MTRAVSSGTFVANCERKARAGAHCPPLAHRFPLLPV